MDFCCFACFCKKSVVRGEKVALFCFNANLAEWLSEYFENADEELKPNYVGTIHKFMTQVSKGAGIYHFALYNHIKALKIK